MVALGVHCNLVSSDTVQKEKCSDTSYLSAIEAFIPPFLFYSRVAISVAVLCKLGISLSRPPLYPDEASPLLQVKGSCFHYFIVYRSPVVVDCLRCN